MLIPQLEGKSLLFGTTASCGLGFMLFGMLDELMPESTIRAIKTDSQYRI